MKVKVKVVQLLTKWRDYYEVCMLSKLKFNFFTIDTTMEADILFQGLLKRKIKADATRNALTVLQRYRFLFNLPRSIEKNIKNVRYLT